MTYLARTLQHYAVACLVLGPRLHSVFDGFALDACFVACRASTLSEDLPVAGRASFEPLGTFGTAAVAGELACAGELAVAVAGGFAVAVAGGFAVAGELAVELIL